MSTSETFRTTRPVASGSNGAPLLALQGITKRFGAVQALSRIQFEIPPGQVTALAGDNGAGKSVTIKTISGLWEPDGGQLLWEGKPVAKHPLIAVRGSGATPLFFGGR
jgi:ABC-type sugar transport system ATPase subunit